MPAIDNKQGAFFVGYSLAAFAYRLVILLTIILLVANHFPKFALLLAAWLIFFQLALPAINYFYQLATNKNLEDKRKRALTFASAGSALLLLIFVAVPLPSSTNAEGLLWLPDETRLKAESSGEVVQVLVKDGDNVEQGQALVQLSNSKMLAEFALKQATLREYDARYQQAWADNRSQAQTFSQDIAAIQAELDLLQKRVDSLTVRSASAGVFRHIETYELVGSFVQRGDSLGVILSEKPTRIRAALTQEEIGLVRQATSAVEVKFAANPTEVLTAQISQQVPAATYDLPSAILGAQGGGRLAVDASHPDGTKTSQMVFLVDVVLSGAQQQQLFGERVYIRFYHPSESAAVQIYRALQQLFIRSFRY